MKRDVDVIGRDNAEASIVRIRYSGDLRYIEHMSLKAAIEAVYVAFSDAIKPLLVEGCPCCMTADEYEALTAKTLRELPSSELDEYANDALLTMGTEDDYAYFLPRILELTVEEGDFGMTSIEITAGKIRMAGFEHWSKDRQSAIRNLWLSYIREMANSEDEYYNVDSWLCAATLIPIPVAPLLDALETAPDVIREMRTVNFMTIYQGRLKNAFLQEPSDGQAEIAQWLIASHAGLK